ncbi:MAG TPA: PAS domain S-box protein [Terriglobales bacterium]|nr:PAS domain S-box protein [Terriglobales bacterium]
MSYKGRSPAGQLFADTRSHMGVKPKKAPEKKSKVIAARTTAGGAAESLPPEGSNLPEFSRLTVNSIADPCLILQQETLQILAANRAAAELYKCSLTQLETANLDSLAFPGYEDTFKVKFESPKARKELQQCCPDGSRVTVETTPSAGTFAGVPAWLCVIHEVSSRARLVQALLESDATNREIIENASDIIYTHDLLGNFTTGNKAVQKILGYSRAETMRMNIRDLVVEEDQEKAKQATLAKLAGNPVPNPYRLRVRTKSAKVLHLEVSTRLVHRDGQPVGVQGIARDISDRIHAEQALRESESKFRAVAESAPCAILIYQGTKFRYVNPTAERITGYSKEELLQLDEFWQLAPPEHRETIKQRAESRQRGEVVPGGYEFKILHKSGVERWMDFTVSTITYEGSLAALLMVFDITDRKRAEAELFASENRFRQLFQRNLAGVYVSTFDGRMLDCNDSFAKIFGYESREDVLQADAQSFYFSYREREQYLSKLRQNRLLSNMETLCRKRDGAQLWVLENVIMVPDIHGGPDLIEGTLVDITERKLTEKKLTESESKFRAVADTASSAIYIHNGRTFLYANRASEEISGYSVDELLQLNPFDIVHPDDRAFVLERGRSRVSGQAAPERYEYRILRKDGSVRWVDFSAGVMQFEGESAIIGTAFDITERRRVEALQAALFRISERANAAQDLEEFLVAIHKILGELIHARNIYVALYDENTDTVSYPYYVDEADEPPVGSFPLGRGFTEYVLRTGSHLLATPEIAARLRASGELERVGSDCVDWLGVPLKTGSKTVGVLAVQSYTEKVRYNEQQVEILNFVSQHIANAILHKRNEEARRESDLRFRTMVQSAVYGIYRSSPDDHFIEVNPALVNMLGYATAEEVLTLKLSRDVYATSEERTSLIHRHAHSGGRVEGIEVKWKRKDGKYITVRLSGRAILDGSDRPRYFEMIAEDVTERRALEDQLRQSQKMEAIGRLAGGVAHDFNNLLTVIKGYSELMLDELKEADPLRAEVEEIKKAADRAATLTRQLLAFSRQQVLAPKVIDLNSVVSNMDKLLNRLLGEDIGLYTVLEGGLGTVKADPGQIEQVVMNLAVNARDAMPRGGKLTIETANVELDESYAREHVGARAGSYVMLAVSDNGTGMTPEVRQRIFEPFFTTKELGKGTGLGLSTVYGIVKQSEGYIWVYSELGQGTSFKVYLPRVDSPAEMISVRSSRKPTFTGHETVLLVEDEDGVRALVRQVLHKHGYTVLEARHGGEALLHCERHQGPIQLLLTDVVLEQMGGPELARRLAGIRPDMRVLYISGYTDDAIIHHGVLTEGTAFLQKPFTTEALAKKIRQVLDN